jgi:hypothetical protein
MKKLLICVLGLTLFFNLTSCKKDENKLVSPKKNDTINLKENTNASLDSIKRKLSNYSLNELFEAYAQNKGLKSVNANQFAALALDEIIDDRLIPLTEYNKLTEDFWGINSTPLTKVMTKNDLIKMLGNAGDTDYVKFTFSNKKDTIFETLVVKDHVFEDKVSCFPALIFKKMIKDVEYDKLEITKSKKEFKNPPSKYNGVFHMVVLKFTDKKGTVQHFDIVDDPTIDTNGY